MKNPMRWWLIPCLGLFLGTLTTQHAIPNLEPFILSIDLGLQSSVPHLQEGWRVIPWRNDLGFTIPRFVMTYSQGGRSTLTFNLPRSDTYLLRVKAVFREPGQTVNVVLNSYPIGSISSSKPKQAEKFLFQIKPEFVHPGLNEITFVNRNPAQDIFYEQVELRDHRSTSSDLHVTVYFDQSVRLRHIGIKAWMILILSWSTLLFLLNELHRFCGVRWFKLDRKIILMHTICWFLPILVVLIGLAIGSFLTPYHLVLRRRTLLLISLAPILAADTLIGLLYGSYRAIFTGVWVARLIPKGVLQGVLQAMAVSREKGMRGISFFLGIIGSLLHQLIYWIRINPPTHSVKAGLSLLGGAALFQILFLKTAAEFLADLAYLFLVYGVVIELLVRAKILESHHR